MTPGTPVLPLALALLLATPGAAQSPVQLTFDWPVGRSAVVTTTTTSSAKLGDEPATTQPAITSRHVLTVQAHPEGRLVVADSLTSSEDAAEDGEVDMPLPTIVASLAGQFVRLERTERLQEVLDSLRTDFSTRIEKLPAAAQPDPGLLDSLLTLETLAEGVRREWADQVGQWAGQSFLPGAVRETEAEEELPFPPGAAVKTTHAAHLVGREPCATAAAADSCVLLEVVVHPDPAGMSAAMDRFFAAMPPEVADQMAVTELKVGIRKRYLVEPTTLLPHRIETETVVDVALATVEGDITTVRTTLEVKEYAWR